MKKYFVILFLFVFSNTFSQKDSTTTSDYQDASEQEVFVTGIEDMPRYKGCENMNNEEANICTRYKIQEYAMKFSYPPKYYTICIETKIYISFIVEIDGLITNIEVLKGYEKVFDQAAVDHIKKMPKFETPGYWMGEPVRVKYNIPININLD